MHSKAISQPDVDSLTSLPTLTDVKLESTRATHIDALLLLPQLSQLSLSFDARSVQLDAARVLATLCQCTQLAELTLDLANPRKRGLHLTVEQLTQCLASLPLLRSLSLTLIAELASLSFLVVSTLPTVLERLYIRGVRRVPFDELAAQCTRTSAARIGGAHLL